MNKEDVDEIDSAIVNDSHIKHERIIVVWRQQFKKGTAKKYNEKDEKERGNRKKK